MKKLLFFLLLVICSKQTIAQTEIEPNNTAATANVLSIPAALINDTMNNSGDKDWFKVHMDKAGVLIVNIPLNANTFRFIIDIYDSTGGNSRSTREAVSDGAAITSETILPAGWWYVKISYDGFFGTWSNAPYNLNISLDTSDACEYNNSFTTACTIGQNSSTQAKIRGLYFETTTTSLLSQDEDYYKVHTTALGNLTASILANLTDINFTITFSDSNYNQIGNMVTAANAGGAVTNHLNNIPAGTWYIAVTSYYKNTNANPYTLNVNLATTGINEAGAFEVDNILIMPNPSMGKFKLSLPSEIQEPYNILITNIIGETIKQFTTSTHKTELYLDAPNGIYFLTASSSNHKYVAKIILNK